MLLALLPALAGALLSLAAAPRAAGAERVAWALLFALALTPFLQIQYAVLAPAFLTRGTFAAAAALAIGLGAGLAWRTRAERATRWGAFDAAALVGAAGVAAFAWRHHSDAELWLQLASYLRRGEAECFYMQTFSFIDGLNVGADPQRVRDAYGIISTPGNSMFTAGWAAALGDRTFQALDVAFRALLFLFSALLLRRWIREDDAGGETGGAGDRALSWALAGGLALAGAAFAALNPFALWIEVLDRNAITYALTPALLYAALYRARGPGGALLCGWLFGIVAGTGLRFLPLTFGLPLALFALRDRRRPAAWAVAGLAAAATFAFNLPHLGHHGFNTLGETTPMTTLLLQALTEPDRTPWVPLPNAALYAADSLAHLGWLGGGLALAGFAAALRRAPLRALGLALIVLPTFAVLASQRDWIEADKGRIFLSAWWPVAACVALGLAAVARRPLRGGLEVGLGALVAAGFAAGLAQIDAPTDDGLYARKPIYQQESGAWAAAARARYARTGALPNYRRLGLKLEHGRKALEDQLFASTLFAASEDGLGAPWMDRWVTPEQIAAPPAQPAPTGWVDVVIDLEALGTTPESAARVVQEDAEGGRPFLDLSDAARLLDIYHKQVGVSWQSQALTVTAMTGRGEVEALNEVHLDLNAFVSFGQDSYGFELVNLVQLRVNGQDDAARASASRALPQTDEAPTLRLRIPEGGRVVLRNWFVYALEGTPHRVDGWVVTPRSGEAEVRYFYGEPESYL